VMLASYFGLPISTTTTLVGSVTGVGLIRSIGEDGREEKLQVRVLLKILSGWILTVVIGFCLTAAFYFSLKEIINRS